MRWTGRWLESGLDQIRPPWNLRCFRRGRHGQLGLAEERIEGTVAGLDADGALVIGERRLALAHAMDLLR